MSDEDCRRLPKIGENLLDDEQWLWKTYSEWINEWMNEWMNEWIKEMMNKWINKCNWWTMIIIFMNKYNFI